MFKWLPFRIRDTPPYAYFTRIILNTKQVEYRRHSDFWNSLLGFKNKDGYVPMPNYGKWRNPTTLAKDGITELHYAGVFLSGKRIHRREIDCISRIPTPKYFSDQGKKDVNTDTCFAFHLNRVLVGKEGLTRQEFYEKNDLQHQCCCVCGEGLKLDTLGSVIFRERLAEPNHNKTGNIAFNTGRPPYLVGCINDYEQMKIHAKSLHKLLEVLALAP